MLRKLLKYDTKNVFKALVVFYILSLFFGLLTRIFLSIDNSFAMNLIGQICSGVTISMMINIVINNLMRLWVRFTYNLYGDESYLTHTLPVAKKDLYLSKFLAACITLLVSTAVIGLTLFIAYYSKENILVLKNILIPVSEMFDVNIVGLLFVVLFILFLEFLAAVQVGYTGIILGHKSNNHKNSLSVLYGFITYMVVQTFVLVVIAVAGIFNKDIMNLFVTTDIINFKIIITICYLSIFTYITALIAEYFVNLKLLNKGVNVD